MEWGLEIECKFWRKQAWRCSCSWLCQPCRVTPRPSTKGGCRLNSPVTHTLLSRGSRSWYLLTAMFSHFLSSHIWMDLFISFLFCKLRCLRSCCPVASLLEVEFISCATLGLSCFQFLFPSPLCDTVLFILSKYCYIFAAHFII